MQIREFFIMSTLKRIDATSVPAVENSLAIFDLPVSVVSYNRTFVKELLPLNTVLRDGPYHFRIYSDSNFWDPSRTYVQLTTSIEKKTDDGDWVAIGEAQLDDKNVSVIQNYGLSFIRQLKILVNSIEIYNSGVHYPYFSYINTELLRSFDSNVGLHSSGCYYADRDGSGKSQTDPTGDGFKKRHERFKEGKKCVTFARLDFDLANQPRLFLPNTDIVFSVWPSNDRYLILAPDYIGADQQAVANHTSYQIKVHDIRLYCTLVDVVQPLQNAIARQLETTPAKYPIRKYEIRTQFLPEGLTSTSFNCFQSILPRRVLVFFVDNTAYDGAPDLSPFSFSHANVESIAIESGGVYVPSTPYRLNFSDQSFMRAYYDFHKTMNQDEGGELELTLPEYLNGYCGFGFDLRSLNKELGDSFELIRNSATVLKVQLSSPVQMPGVQLLVWGEFDAVITINNDRVISLDGSI